MQYLKNCLPVVVIKTIGRHHITALIRVTAASCSCLVSRAISSSPNKGGIGVYSANTGALDQTGQG